MTRSTWQRVSKRRPCPVCKRPDWCLYTGEPSNPEAAICQRIESAKFCGEAGWLHILHRNGPTWSPRVRRIELSAARIGAKTTDLAKLAADFRAAVQPEALDKLAASLGVSVASLSRLCIGWSAHHRAWAFSMSNAAGNLLGIRLRLVGGKKLSVKGGHEGLFIPGGIDAHGLLLIAEGPTDTAALLDLGFNVVGRPSCSGGAKLLVEVVRRLRPSGVVVVADGDAPGQRGAENLAAVLVAYCPVVRIITPPTGIKDMRVWKRHGATGADVSAAINAAPICKLAVRFQRRVKTHG